MAESFKRTTLTVMIFSMVTRLIAFIFKIYVSRAVGAEALGLFQISAAVWGLFVTVCGSGLSVTVSRHTAEQFALGKAKKVGGTVSGALIIGLTITVAAIGAFFLFSDGFSTLFTDKRAIPLFYIMLPALISTCAYNILRSYIMGRRSYILYSVTELVEELLNVVGVLVLLSGIFGAINGATAITLSFAVCDVICYIVIASLYFKSGGSFGKPCGFKPLLKSSTPITLMRVFTGLASSITAIVLPMRLVDAGLTAAEATAEYGRAVGMAYPLLFAPLAITSALSIVLLPEVAALSAEKNTEKIASRVDGAMSFITLITVFFFAVYAALGENIGMILFADAKAGKFLALSAGMVLPLAMSQLTTTTLNSMAREKICFVNNLIAIAAMTLCVYFLPKFIGIYALAVAQTLCFGLIFILNSIVLVKAKAVKLNYYKPLVQTGLFALVLVAFVRLIYNVLVPHIRNDVLAIMLGVFMTVCYAVFLQVFKLLDITGYYHGLINKLKGRKKTVAKKEPLRKKRNHRQRKPSAVSKVGQKV